jgi:hypothetical protein
MAIWARDWSAAGGYSQNSFMGIDLSDNIAQPWQATTHYDGIQLGSRGPAGQWLASSESWARTPSDNSGTAETDNTIRHIVSDTQKHCCQLEALPRD